MLDTRLPKKTSHGQVIGAEVGWSSQEIVDILFCDTQSLNNRGPYIYAQNKPVWKAKIVIAHA